MDIRGPEVPPFDVYRDYVDGWDAFWHGDGLQAEELFLRSARGDTLFTPAVLAAAMSGVQPQPLRPQRLARSRARDPLRPLDRKDRLTLQIIDARCRGRNEEMLRLTLERAKLDPPTPGNLTSAAAAASWANRPGVAARALAAHQPRRGSRVEHRLDARRLLGRPHRALSTRSAAIARSWPSPTA